MQVINTKHFGPVEFKRTWVADEGRHVGLLAKGGYAHLTGHPVVKEQDLIELIPKGEELDAALEWWKNRDKIKETPETKRIMLELDGSYRWEDGSPITAAADIMTALPPGPQLEAVLAWFHAQHVAGEVEKEVEKKVEADQPTSAVAELAKEVQNRKAGKK